MATHGDPEGAPMPHFGTAPHSSQQFPPPHARSPDSSHPSMSPAAGDSYGCGCCLTTPHHSAAMLKMQEAQALCMALSPGPGAEQEELLLQLLATKDAAGAPSLDKSASELAPEEVGACSAPLELEGDF
ncbi:hypothetical protein C0989_004764 [Termitomyces sp. Mn162]|nr:hypothetical protein C0989_004764 [Termitomyces sp. Mn162]